MRRSLSVLVVLVVVGAGCGSGVQTGSVTEFCEDWAALNDRFDGLELDDSKSIEAFADGMADVRFPPSIADQVDGATKGVRSLVGNPDSTVGKAERQAIGNYADTAC